MTDEFKEFQKIGRLSREIVITEKLDGTNGLIEIGEDSSFQIGSRTQWITPERDNYGFARWATEHKDELIAGLGAGRHFGEWWGQGIQRKYGLAEKRWSLFNVSKWTEARPACCHVVPTLWRGDFDTNEINRVLAELQVSGSIAAPGFMKPEGVVIYHAQANVLFKKTYEKDDAGKGREPIAAASF
jgi:hypothetical protein